MIPPTNKERFEKLRKLSPIEAVRAWLDGAFGLGDEPALIEAIRKYPRVSISDEAIIDVFIDIDAMDDKLDAPACLERLAAER